MSLSVDVFATVGLGLVAVWVGLQARWAEEDRPILLPAMGFLLCAAASVALTQTGAGQVPIWRLLGNLAGLARDFFLLAWFVGFLYPERARGLVTVALSGQAVLGTVAIWAWCNNPARVFDALASGEVPREVAPLLFVVAILFSHLCVAGLCALWSATYARSVIDTAARVGLVVLGAGFAAVCASAALRVVPSAAVLAGAGWTQTLTVNYPLRKLVAHLGYVLMMVGVVIPITVSLGRGLPLWRVNRRLHRRLRPLAVGLHEAFPQLSMSRVPASGWVEWLQPRGTHRRFYRRLIEIMDGLLQLRPWCRPEVGRDALEAARADGLDEAAAVLRAYAVVIATALGEKAAGTLPGASHVPAIGIEGGVTLAQEANRLVALSVEFGRQQRAATVPV